MNDYTAMNNNNHYNMAELLEKYEEDNKRLIREKNEVMKDFNTRMKIHLEEVRLLKEVNEGLQTDLEELRDLCCYLDDDRHKCRKLAKEWQNFGRYVSSILQTKESSYKEEVDTFNIKHETIVAENNSLKRICQDLEKRSNGYNQTREFICTRCSQKISFESNRVNQRSLTDPPTAVINHSTYNTEQLLKPDDRSTTDDDSPVFSPDVNIFSQVPTGTRRKKKVSFAEPDGTNHCDSGQPKHVPFNAESNSPKDNISPGILRNGIRRSHSNDQGSSSSNESDSSITNMSRAMQVLEIHSELQDERRKIQDPLKDKEVAVLTEMCNVVWRKLSSDDPSNGKNTTLTHNGFEDDVIYEDLL